MNTLLRHSFLFVVLISFLSACQNSKVDVVNDFDWKPYRTSVNLDSNYETYTTYLPVYSQIYIESIHRKHPLTTTVSIRNVNLKDTVFIHASHFYNTEGKLIRNYIDSTIYVKPLETLEIVLNEKDVEGGSGANFIFEWSKKNNSELLFFQSVMVTTSGQQGIAFTTEGLTSVKK